MENCFLRRGRLIEGGFLRQSGNFPKILWDFFLEVILKLPIYWGIYIFNFDRFGLLFTKSLIFSLDTCV